ncbi:MAG: hypothetical protein IPM12_15805 [Flavobacteriales bacterium]|nr:hypothetical protein [Flavobacteriales bacterium]
MRTSALAFASALSGLAAAQFQWEQLPDFPGTARDDAAAFTIDCDVYVGTGMQVGWSLTNDFWRYDSFSQTWSPSTTLPASPRQYCTAQSLFSQGYLFGGLDASGPLSELWSFDSGSQSWIQRASLPGAGRYACGSFVLASNLYICGGIIAGGTALNELWKYDPFTDSWEQRSSLPGVGRHRMATAEGGFVAGGADSSYAPLDECWSYNTFGDEWTPMPAMPEGRFGGSGASWTEGLYYIAGAIDNSNFRATTFRLSASGWELCRRGASKRAAWRRRCSIRLRWWLELPELRPWTRWHNGTPERLVRDLVRFLNRRTIAVILQRNPESRY